jgi:diguanylate cyclase (GGDEF)-like protein
MLRAIWDGALVFTQVERVEDAQAQLISGSIQVILLENTDPEHLALLEQARQAAPDVPIVVLADEYEDGSAIVAIRAGAQDFLAKTQLTPATLRRTLKHAVERKRSEMQLAHRALEDPLTRLPNRTLFMDRLGVALDRSRRRKSVTGVLFLDVDQFKAINDTLGHHAGDVALTEIADRLRSVMRPMDTVARFGGDEFTFLFEDLARESEMVAIAERVREVASGPIKLDDVEVDIAVSIGVATASEPGTSPEALIRQADAAMYRAKGSGGAGFALDNDAVRERAAVRAAMGAELQAAVDHDELRVHYQPRFLLGTDVRKVTGFEALVRWQHPERGLITPGDFIEIAEETGIVGAIGDYVLAEALGMISKLRKRHSDLTMSVNMSLSQLADPGLISGLQHAVDAAGLDPGALCVEINERTVSAEPDVAIRVAKTLKAAGVSIAVDDYGTGSSSLQSITRLHADVLKIHESYVGELGDTADENQMVGAVVELGHALGMSVVAEGVETDAQLTSLRLLGVDGAQGYLLCEPVTGEEAGKLVAGAAAA